MELGEVFIFEVGCFLANRFYVAIDVNLLLPENNILRNHLKEACNPMGFLN